MAAFKSLYQRFKKTIGKINKKRGNIALTIGKEEVKKYGLKNGDYFVFTKEEYEDLLSFADPQRNTILKTRYRYPFCGKLIELDLFPFWKGQAFCEVELESEDEAFSLPDFIEVIREVTSEKEYRNHALSKKIPQEEKF